MRPEAAAYLEKARENLDEAKKIYGIGLASVAARSAYYAGFHTAEAFIIAKGDSVKTVLSFRRKPNPASRVCATYK